MGRSPSFTIESIQVPSVDQTTENLEMIKDLNSLKEDQKVQITFKSEFDKFGIYRSISCYDYTPSELSPHITYVVTSNNYEPCFAKIGLNVFALKDPIIPNDIHMTGWVITSDGYIRETEHFTILYKLTGIKIIED